MTLDPISDYYGCWGDSGAYDKEWASGGFIKLLSFLRGETYEETVEYLLTIYSQDFADTDSLKLPRLRIPFKRTRTPLNESLLVPYMFRHSYLRNRGISEPVQQLMDVGYDRGRKAITMPWRLPDGKLANIKYRRINTKIFWYEPDGLLIRDLVYGIDVIYKKRLKYAVLCEAEIDAMSFMSAGVPAIAIGCSSITEEKAELIRKSPLETLYIATDNDKPGNKLRAACWRRLDSYLKIIDVNIPLNYKDANEAHVKGENIEKYLQLGLAERTFIRL